MIIKELKNPFTEEYYELKNNIFSDNFPWFLEVTTNNEYGKFFFSHIIVKRPDKKIPVSKINSNYFDSTINVLNQIVEHNDLNVNSFLRINVNLTVNHGGGISCSPHYDHDFEHKNLLIYLNESSGPTVVIDSENKNKEYFHPKKDVIITFEGEHYHYQPNVGEKRVVLVATYI